MCVLFFQEFQSVNESAIQKIPILNSEDVKKARRASQLARKMIHFASTLVAPGMIFRPFFLFEPTPFRVGWQILMLIPLFHSNENSNPRFYFIFNLIWRLDIFLGVSTDHLNSLLHDEIIRLNAYPSTLFYEGFPKSISTSVNNIAVHGVPDSRFGIWIFISLREKIKIYM